MPKKAAPVIERDEEKSTEEQSLDQSLGRFNTPESREAALSKLTPWKPGQSGNPKGRPKLRTFVDEARDILDGGVPGNLRELVCKRTGLPLKSVDGMSLRQAVVLYLVYDYLKKGKSDAIAQLLDRTDPKTRRVEGKMDHEHTVRGAIAALVGEVEAAELYKGLLGGGTVQIEAGDTDK